MEERTKSSTSLIMAAEKEGREWNPFSFLSYPPFSGCLEVSPLLLLLRHLIDAGLPPSLPPSQAGQSRRSKREGGRGLEIDRSGEQKNTQTRSSYSTTCSTTKQHRHPQLFRERKHEDENVFTSFPPLWGQQDGLEGTFLKYMKLCPARKKYNWGTTRSQNSFVD